MITPTDVQNKPSVATSSDGRRAAVRRLHAATATIAFSVFADSSLEHYRGGFYRPAMFIAPIVSGITLAAGLGGTRPSATSGAVRTSVYTSAALAGLLGFGYHVGNLTRREGGRTWLNLFYGAPVAAPLAIHMAGILGLLAGAVHPRRDRTATIGGLRPSQAVGALVTAGLLGTAAEAGLLHFRGAFQNPHMFLPVTIPPVTALALAAGMSTGRCRPLARLLLRATAAVGVAGVAFHAYGVHRNMGGWRNWTQNIQHGPPLPAPPAFTGLALAGLAALELARDEEAR